MKLAGLDFETANGKNKRKGTPTAQAGRTRHLCPVPTAEAVGRRRFASAIYSL